jgi:hypothetical protein
LGAEVEEEEAAMWLVLLVREETVGEETIRGLRNGQRDPVWCLSSTNLEACN